MRRFRRVIETSQQRPRLALWGCSVCPVSLPLPNWDLPRTPADMAALAVPEAEARAGLFRVMADLPNEGRAGQAIALVSPLATS
jgi:hypothetical protein